MTGTTDTITADQILNHAADLIDAHGWCQGTYENGRGQLCATGAINRAGWVSGLSPAGDPWQQARHLVKAEINNEPLTVWNDRPGRTQDEVVQVLRDAAKAARGGAGREPAAS